MLKLGITQLSQLLNKETNTLFRKEMKNVSIALYDEILNQSNYEELSEQILLGFSDDRGAYKRTYAKRFEEFDVGVLEILKNHIKTNNLIVHDVGVSDGRTSCDFYEKIQALNSNLVFYASDYDPNIVLINFGKTILAINQTNKILQIVHPPFVYNIYKRDSYRHYPINHILRLYLEYTVAPSILKKYKAGSIENVKNIQLFCVKAKKLADTQSNFHLIKHDILSHTPINEPIQILRAMNVLNWSYFDEVNMKKIIKNFFGSLDEGGFLITGSNQDSNTRVDGAIYQKSNSGFKKIWHSHNGSPVDGIIAELKMSKTFEEVI